MTSTNAKRIYPRTIAITGLLLLTAFLGVQLRPTIIEGEAPPKLDQVVPKEFGVWRDVPSPMVQVDTFVNEEGASRDQPYDDLVSRTYINGQGEQIMVALAYGKHQRQEVKIHRPELCYPAQGWRVLKLTPVTFPFSTPTGQPVIGHRLLTQRGNGAIEAVSYWIRIGNSYSDSAWQTRMTIMKEGLQGRMTDGILVRVSERMAPGQDEELTFKRLELFAEQLVANTRSDGRHLLLK
jgi:EpsI family protein